MDLFKSLLEEFYKTVILKKLPIWLKFFRLLTIALRSSKTSNPKLFIFSISLESSRELFFFNANLDKLAEEIQEKSSNAEDTTDSDFDQASTTKIFS